ncbi:MAG TPA: phosphatase PAP2 family protein [Albidovulum sp.]|uniref:phosphatase PAP2 family protein n=1 Tax=Albidovulum sp. TaxID=1872424 RepID=UPI002CC2AC96|nr:phosphatase PAP2 family protein [Albidovulum sp.]
MADLTKAPAAMMALLIDIAKIFSNLMYGRLGWLTPPLLLIVVLWVGPKACFNRLGSVALMVALSIFLQIGFVFAKSAIPELVPFYADPFLARMDRALFFGRDGWEVTHALVGQGFSGLFSMLYMPVWSVLALGFPILIALTDPDRARVGRYAWLFVLAWFVVGNVLATLGSSVGPIYYDRLLASERFADLSVALQQSGLAASALGLLQDQIWAGSNDATLPLSLISAFPSVHVAVATVAALYLKERAPRLAPVGYAFLGVIAFISVYSGYHYATCAIAGWAVVVALGKALKRWMPGMDAGAVPLSAWPLAAPGIRQSRADRLT